MSKEVIVKGADPNVEAVIARLRARSAKAIQQYGADTTRSDYALADWLAEIRDESMDRAVYAQAAIAAMERASAAGNERGEEWIAQCNYRRKSDGALCRLAFGHHLEHEPAAALDAAPAPCDHNGGCAHVTPYESWKPAPATESVAVMLPRWVYEWFLRRNWYEAHTSELHDPLMAITDACRAALAATGRESDGRAN